MCLGTPSNLVKNQMTDKLQTNLSPGKQNKLFSSEQVDVFNLQLTVLPSKVELMTLEFSFVLSGNDASDSISVVVTDNNGYEQSKVMVRIYYSKYNSLKNTFRFMNMS